MSTPASPAALAPALQRPPPDAIERLVLLMEPWKLLVSPVFEGVERIPDDRPLLFVGNHTLFGILDLPLLFIELFQRKSIFLRSLGDHSHFKIPVWSEIVRQLGAVDGTRENALALMRGGECLLVFPGGAREVAKRRGEKYHLLWKDRLGFARIALETGATVVPFASVGAEDAFEILVDGNDILAHPLGKIAVRAGILREDFLLPLVKPIPIKQLERFYFCFCDPIPTHQFKGDGNNDNARLLRDRTKAAVEKAIAHLMTKREQDPQRRFVDRLKALEQV